MSTVVEALAIAAATVSLAGAVGYGIYRVTVPKRDPSTPADIGRKWLGWTALLVTVSTLPPFFRLYSADVVLKWLIGLVFYGGLAFVLGWAYGKMFKFKAAEGRSFESENRDTSRGTDTKQTGPRTHYDNLQIAETASPEVIKGAYKFLSQKWHPDKNPDNRAEAERITRLINEAFAVLSDPKRRKEHDQWIRAQREHAAKHHRRDPADPALASVPTSPIVSEQRSGFLKRSWLMLLSTTSLVMVLGVFPYQLIASDFKWGYLAGLAFWLGVGHYAYTALFHQELVAEGKRQDAERRREEAAPRRKATTVGWIVGFASWPISVAAMMLRGDPFDVAGLMSIFLALAAGLLAWSVAALFQRATTHA